MKKVVAFFLCVVFPAFALAGDNGYKISYDGGSISGYKAGTGMKLFLDGDHIRVMDGMQQVTELPAVAITEISYGQETCTAGWARPLESVCLLWVSAL